MGFLEMIGFALYHAIKEEAEEERFRKLDEAIRGNLKKTKKRGLFESKQKRG